MQEHSGTVKWYDPNKAFGFISGAPEGDVFVHRSNLEPGRDELIEGQEVVFQTRRGHKGYEAFDVRVTRESHMPPRPRTPRELQGRGAGRSREGGFGDRASGRKPAPSRPHSASVPAGPLECTVISRDREDRFMFVRSEEDELEVFVHSSLFRHLPTDLRRGDRVKVTVEQSARGLRATSLTLD